MSQDILHLCLESIQIIQQKQSPNTTITNNGQEKQLFNSDLLNRLNYILQEYLSCVYQQGEYKNQLISKNIINKILHIIDLYKLFGKQTDAIKPLNDSQRYSFAQEEHSQQTPVTQQECFTSKLSFDDLASTANDSGEQSRRTDYCVTDLLMKSDAWQEEQFYDEESQYELCDVGMDETNQSMREQHSSGSESQDIQSIQQKLVLMEKSISDSRIKQLLCCGVEMVHIQLAGQDNKNKKQYKCLMCKKICSMSKKTMRVDRNEHSSKNTSYQAIKHFDTVFRFLFISPMEHIESDVKEKLREFMERDQKQKVSIDDVRQYLKQLPGGQGSKFNKMDAAIMSQLNGETIEHISNHEFVFIKEVYRQAVTIFYSINENRKNTPNCSFFIRSIIDLFYKNYNKDKYKRLVRNLYQQKENTIFKIQKVWIQIKQRLDIDTLQHQFVDVMRLVEIDEQQRKR